MHIDTIIFDMDGTLIDTEKYYRIFWPMALKEFGYEMTDEQALSMRSLGGLSPRPGCGRCLARSLTITQCGSGARH